MIERGQILPTAWFEKINPAINGADKLCVLKESIPWPDGALRRVCVSNYGMQSESLRKEGANHHQGFGGANAAVLLEQAPDLHSTIAYPGINGHDTNGCIAQSTPKLYAFSARSSTSLDSYIQSVHSFLETSTCNSDDLCFTLGQRRAHLSYRTAFPAGSVTSLHHQILAHCKTTASSGKTTKAGEPVVAFVCK